MGGLAGGWAEHLEGGVWGKDGWQVLAAAGAPRRRVVGGAVVVVAAWMDRRFVYGRIAYG